MKIHTWKSAAAFTILLTCVAAPKADASPVTDNGFGLGFILGDPTGLSASLPVGPGNAFNFLLGYQLSDSPNLTALGDYVWRRSDLIPVDVGKVSVYYGPGVRLAMAARPEAGIRAVIGIDYVFEDTPVQVLLEVCPGINVVPDTRPSSTAGLGLRYFF